MDIKPVDNKKDVSRETPEVKTKPEGKPPTERQTGKPDPYAYTITDRAFGDFQVLNTANGWWAEKVKVQHIIDAYKIDANDDEACSYAGISLDQLRYFKELHPEFSRVKHACHQILGLKAKQALANKVEIEPEWYLERKRKDEYSTRTEQTGANGRDLYEGLSEDIKLLGEELRKPNNDEKHTGNTTPGNTDAGQDGARDEATTATGTAENKNIPTQSTSAV